MQHSVLKEVFKRGKEWFSYNLLQLNFENTSHRGYFKRSNTWVEEGKRKNMAGCWNGTKNPKESEEEAFEVE